MQAGTRERLQAEPRNLKGGMVRSRRDKPGPGVFALLPVGHLPQGVLAMSQQSKTVTRELLYEQVWETPMSRLARDYGVSDSALAKTCRRLGVPLPPRGHWAKLQYGKKVPPRPLLPKQGKDGRDQATVTRTAPRQPPDSVVDEAIRSLVGDEDRIKVADQLRNPHPAVKAPPSRTGTSSRGVPDSMAGRTLSVNVSDGSRSRALRILDALCKALEALGHPVTAAGAFSNRASSVNCLLLVAGVVAVPGSRFSPRSAFAAATSGPKHRRCNIHNGLTCTAHGPTASLAASLHPRPGGQPALAPACRASGSRKGLVRRLRAAPTSGTARRTARCCAGLPTACGPRPRAPCQRRTASRSPAPSPSTARPA